MMKCTFFAISLMLLLSGCSMLVLRSDRMPQADHADKIIYALPKGMIRLAYIKAKDATSFIIEPVFLPDPNQTFTLRRCLDPSYDDEVQVSVDSNGLLKAISVTTTSQTGAILVEAAKLATKFAALQTTEEKYFDVSLDPNIIPTYSENLPRLQELDKIVRKCEKDKNNREIELDTAEKMAKNATGVSIKSARDAFEEATRQYIKAKIDFDKANNDKVTQQDWANHTTFANRYAEFGLNYASIEWLDPNINSNDGSDKLVHESTSIFYKPLKPCKVRVSMNESYFESIIYLPNKSPIIAIDITRPAFVKQVTKLTFAHGALTEIYLNKPSELLAGLQIPGNIINAIVGSALPLQIQLTLDKATTALLDAQGNQITTLQQQLQSQQEQLESQQAGK